ncbi:MAG: STAS domain-containing protein [Planctomycetes bacterium]|nr:STAS domain-containing protein [Planctomycetota bacterium]
MSTPQGTPDELTRRCPVCDAKLGVEVLRFGETVCSNCGHVVWFEKRCSNGVVILDVLSGTVAINTDIDRVSKILVLEGSVPNIVLNLSSLKFISSAFVAGMIALQKRVRAAGGRLILCGMHPIVRETLHGARLDTFFDIHDNEQEALASF